MPTNNYEEFPIKSKIGRPPSGRPVRRSRGVRFDDEEWERLKMAASREGAESHMIWIQDTLLSRAEKISPAQIKKDTEPYALVREKSSEAEVLRAIGWVETDRREGWCHFEPPLPNSQLGKVGRVSPGRSGGDEAHQTPQTSS